MAKAKKTSNIIEKIDMDYDEEIKKQREEQKEFNSETIKKELDKVVDNVKVKVEPVVFADVERKFLLVRVGSSTDPAGTDEIEEVDIKINKLLKDNGINCVVFVTHHAVDISFVR